MNTNKLEGVIPDHVLLALTPDFLSKAGIDGPKRLSNFLGQCDEESEVFSHEVENLNYSAQALQSLFHIHFPNGDYDAYARQPEKIANRIYANRMGNGDENSGDGWKFRGRGFLQLTGKDGYQAFQDWVNETVSENVDFITNPDLVATAPYDLLSAAWFFNANNLWQICDKGVDLATVTIVTRHVNGGTTNLQQRYDYSQKIYTALIA